MARYYESSTRGLNYDRFVDRFDDSTLSRVKQHYWTAKQLIRSKLGKKEDEHLLASDAEFDAKLQLFYSVKSTCEQMLACVEQYQDFICDLSQQENVLGRFLKFQSKQDKTQAGKMMSAVGRAQSFASQQRLALRVPLVRFYQELDVFTERAVSDCLLTVEATEKARTEYRGSLLWMKKVSEQLDPDTYRQLEKFRAVQAAVKRNKDKFDKLKLDCLQKTDLLAASRCNLFSQLMANYQHALLTFWEKTSQAHMTVSENFKGYQHYEFVILKDLTETSKKLAELTTDDDTVRQQDEKDQSSTEIGNDDTTLISLNETDDDDMTTRDSLQQMLFGPDSPEHKPPTESNNDVDGGGGESPLLKCDSPLGIPIDESSTLADLRQLPVLHDIHPLPDKSDSSVAIPRLAPPPGWSMPNSQHQLQASEALLGLSLANDSFDQLLLTSDNSTTTTSDQSSFTYQWENAFGTSEQQSNTVDEYFQIPTIAPISDTSSYLPSHLIDFPNDQLTSAMSSNVIGSQRLSPINSTNKNTNSNWDKLFDDLDPLKMNAPDSGGVNQC